jgi:hypothetical protein
MRSTFLSGTHLPPPPAGPADEPEPTLPLDPYAVVDGAVSDVGAAVDDDPQRQRGLLAAEQGRERTHSSDGSRKRTEFRDVRSVSPRVIGNLVEARHMITA